MITADITLTTIGPFAATLPDGNPRYDGFPVMPRGLDPAGRPALTAYIPAGTLRGKLRRGMTMPSLLADAAAGNAWSLHRVYEVLVGQSSTSEKKKAPAKDAKAGDEKVEEELIDLHALAAKREAEPVIDLMGSGLGAKSRLLVSHLLPVENVEPFRFSGVRTDLDKTDGILEALSDGDRAAWATRSASNTSRANAEAEADQIRKVLHGQKEEVRARAKKPMPMLPAAQIEELQARLAELDEEVKEAKGGMSGMAVSTLMPIGYWAMPAGTVLKGRLVIDRPRERDIQLLLTALDQMSRRPLFGAQQARGCGEYTMSLDFKREGELFIRVLVGGYQPAIVTDLRDAKEVA